MAVAMRDPARRTALQLAGIGVGRPSTPRRHVRDLVRRAARVAAVLLGTGVAFLLAGPVAAVVASAGSVVVPRVLRRRRVGLAWARLEAELAAAVAGGAAVLRAGRSPS